MLKERGFSFSILLSKTQGELGAARILPKRGEREEGREKGEMVRQGEGKREYVDVDFRGAAPVGFCTLND